MNYNDNKKTTQEVDSELEEKRIMMISTHGYVASEPPLGAPDTGGQVVYVLELSKKLAQFGSKVDIFTRRFEDQAEIDYVAENVRIIRINCGGKDFIPKEYLYNKIPEWVKNTLGFIKRNKLSYSFVNSHYWDAGLAGSMIGEKMGIAHVHTPHSLGTWKKEQMESDFPEDTDAFENKYNFSDRIKNETMIYRTCDLLIATTPVQVDKIESDYDIPEKRISMVPPGYDDNRFFPIGEPSRQALRAQIGFKGKTVFAVSRLAVNKGFDLLLDSFALVKERMPDAILVLAIGFEDRDDVEEGIYQELLAIIKQRGIEKNVKFIGFIPDEELPDYYRAADLFVLSSRYEPFGMTAVEAMASGTPCVVTIHGGLARVLEHGIHALLADTFDREELGISMYQALKYETLYRRLSEKGAQRARARFTWTGVTQKLLNEVEDLTDVSIINDIKLKERI
ncbi:MAG: glycosyltransferase [Spirochaetota bacterium]|nr:glycosyltransferase [Spirochaetota bacterium]